MRWGGQLDPRHADAPAVVNGLFARMADDAGVEWIHYLTLRNSGASLAAFKRASASPSTGSSGGRLGLKATA